MRCPTCTVRVGYRTAVAARWRRKGWVECAGCKARFQARDTRFSFGLLTVAVFFGAYALIAPSSAVTLFGFWGVLFVSDVMGHYTARPQLPPGGGGLTAARLLGEGHEPSGEEPRE